MPLIIIVFREVDLYKFLITIQDLFVDFIAELFEMFVFTVKLGLFFVHLILKC